MFYVQLAPLGGILGPLKSDLHYMLNDSKIAQLNSERPLHQTAVGDFST